MYPPYNDNMIIKNTAHHQKKKGLKEKQRHQEKILPESQVRVHRTFV
jgi:hypothetical protein